MKGSKRVVGYDIARAFAVFGMVIINFKLVMGAQTGTAWLTDIVSTLEGRAVAVFVVLAGVGITLMSRSAIESQDPARILASQISISKRAFLLIFVGFLYTPIWPADILHFYGFYFFLAALMIGAPSRVLWVMSVIVNAVFLVCLVYLDYDAGWNWKTLDYIDLWTVEGMLRHLFFNGFHPVFPWVAFVFVGMWLGRLDVFNSVVRKKLLVYSFIVWVFVEILSDTFLLNISPEHFPELTGEDIASLFDTAPMPPMPLYMIAGSAFAIFFITLCAWVGELLPNSKAIHYLAKTGELSLSLYVLHIILGMGVLEALGILEHQTIDMAMFSAILFCVFSVIFAVLWRSKFRLGPLEWIFKRILAKPVN